LVGTPTFPYAGVPPLFAKFPDGNVYNLAEITSNELASVQWSSMKVGSEPCSEINIGWLFTDGIAPTWPEGTKRIQFDKWLIWMNDGIIISLFANTWGEGSYLPSIGKTPDQLHCFPLTQDEVIDVFGVPDRIIDYFGE